MREKDAIEEMAGMERKIPSGAFNQKNEQECHSFVRQRKREVYWVLQRIWVEKNRGYWFKFYETLVLNLKKNFFKQESENQLFFVLKIVGKGNKYREVPILHSYLSDFERL